MDDWLTLILTILVGFLGFFYAFIKKVNKFEKLGILHIKPLPFFGNTMAAVIRRCHFIETINKTYKLNDDAKYVGFFEFGQPIIVIRSPELIKNIIVRNFDHFVDHREFVNPENDPLAGKNLIGLRGERWKEVRNLLRPAFTISKMKKMFQLMSKCGKNFVDYLAKDMADQAKVLDTKDAFTRYTNDVIAACAFGISVDSMRNPKNDLYLMGKDITKFEGIRVAMFLFTRYFPKIAKLFSMRYISSKSDRIFTNIVKETIETRDHEGINRPDLIQFMMDTRDKKNGDCPDLTFQEMTAHSLFFYFGGFESSSNAMCFVAHQIAVNSEVQEKLFAEIAKVAKETNGEPTYEAVNGMEYLDAVINETLRMYPVNIVVDRLCVKPFELPAALPGAKPVIIEPGQNIWIPVCSIHKDRKYFANPEKFDPERFMGSAKNDIDPFTYMPFGQGPRMCLGYKFALLEIKVLIFHLLVKFYLKPSAKMHLPLELSKTTFSIIPKGGFRLQLESRNMKE